MSSGKPILPNETLVQIAGRIAHLGGWIEDRATDRVFWSDEVCDIHEVPHGTSPKTVDAAAFVLPEWRP